MSHPADIQSDLPEQKQQTTSQQQVDATPPITVPSSAVLFGKHLDAANFETSSVPCTAIQVGVDSAMSDTPTAGDKEDSTLLSSILDVPAAGDDMTAQMSSKNLSSESNEDKDPGDFVSSEEEGGGGGRLLQSGDEGVPSDSDIHMLPLAVLSDSLPHEDLTVSLEHMEMEVREDALPVTQPSGRKRKRRWRRKQSSKEAVSLPETDVPVLADLPDEDLSKEASKVSKRKIKRELRAQAKAARGTRKEKRGKMIPNAFVSVRITSAAIREKLEAMQAQMTEHDPKLAGLCVSTEKLHITLMVMRLENEEAVERFV